MSGLAWTEGMQFWHGEKALEITRLLRSDVAKASRAATAPEAVIVPKPLGADEPPELEEEVVAVPD